MRAKVAIAAVVVVAVVVGVATGISQPPVQATRAAHPIVKPALLAQATMITTITMTTCMTRYTTTHMNQKRSPANVTTLPKTTRSMLLSKAKFTA